MTVSENLANEVLARIAAFFSADAAQLSGRTRLVEDLCADSLELLDLVMELNDHYVIEISADDLLTMHSIDDVAAVIARLRAACGA